MLVNRLFKKSRLTMSLHSINRCKTVHKIFSIENNGKIQEKCAKFSQNVSSNFHMYEIILFGHL